MIGLDMNVLVRYLVQDDPGQSSKATQVIAQRCMRDAPGFVNRIVLCGLVWVLKSACGYSKDRIVAS
jgi:predicted nucleic-acid-binding protein